MAATLFERYGGFAQLSQVVSAFYDKFLDSPLTSPYFEGIDMRRLIDHQTKFIASLMGGPASYTDEALLRAHQHLDINEAAFAEMAELLRETLEDFDFDDADIATIHKEIADRSPYIVARR